MINSSKYFESNSLEMKSRKVHWLPVSDGLKELQEDVTSELFGKTVLSRRVLKTINLKDEVTDGIHLFHARSADPGACCSLFAAGNKRKIPKRRFMILIEKEGRICI